MHTHSIYSDGYYTPDELCRRAKTAWSLSITDHENGEEEKRAAAETGLVRFRLRECPPMRERAKFTSPAKLQAQRGL